ncbi:MAG: oligosaccharide flippase family protein [Christensenellales bacterium]|jgi:O-antigen/teichoic acid export membrane protein
MRMVKGVAADFVVLSAVKVVTAVSGMLTTAILSRRYTLEEYGTYSQALILVALVSALILFALADASNYFFNRSNDLKERKRYINTIFFLETVVGLTAALLVVVLQGVIVGYYENAKLLPLIYIIAISPLLTNYIVLYQVLHVSIGNARAISVRNFIWALLKLFLAVVLTTVDNSVFWMLLALLTVDALSVLYYWTAFSRKSFLVRPFNFDVDCIKPILRFAVPMAVYTISKSIAREIPKLFVSRYLGVEALAIFTNASKALPFDLVLGAMITVIMPYFTRYANLKDKSSIRNLLRLYFEIGYMTMWIMAGCALIVPEDMIGFLYGDKYLPGREVFVIYIIYDIIQFANLSLILSARGKTKTLIKVALVLVFTNFILTYFLTRQLGMLGAAVATLLSAVITITILLKQSFSEVSVKVAEIFDIRVFGNFVLKAALVSAVVAIFARFVSRSFNSHVIRLLVVYPVFMLATSLVNWRVLISRLKNLNSLRSEDFSDPSWNANDSSE